MSPDLWDEATRQLKPHTYWPDVQAMGDCLYCGNVYDIPQHRELDAEPPESGRLVQQSLWS